MKFWLLVVVFFGTGCASRLSHYGGEKPNFELSGEAGKKEVQRFRLEEDNFWACGFPCFESDPQKRQHTWESMLPLIETASPDAVQKYKRSVTWWKVQLYSLGVGLAGLALGLATRGDERKTFLTASLAGSMTSIGSSFVVGWIRSDIPDTYNRDLNHKFQPSLVMNWNF